MHVEHAQDVLLVDIWFFLRPTTIGIRVKLGSAKCQIAYELFYRTDLRVQSSVRIQVAAVEVSTGHRRPIVASDDSINIEHRYDFENDPLAQLLGGEAVAHDGLDEAMHHPTGV